MLWTSVTKTVKYTAYNNQHTPKHLTSITVCLSWITSEWSPKYVRNESFGDHWSSCRSCISALYFATKTTTWPCMHTWFHSTLFSSAVDTVCCTTLSPKTTLMSIVCQPILIIFGTNVAQWVSYQIIVYFPISSNECLCFTWGNMNPENCDFFT